MKTPIVGLGVILLIIGIIIAAVYNTNSAWLYSGIGVLVLGIIVAGAGVVMGPKKAGMATQAKGGMTGQYSCTKCGMKFNSEAEMKAHTKEKHGM